MKFAIIAVLLSCGLVAAAQDKPFVPAGQTRQLTPHVWVIEDKDTVGSVPNVGFVVGSKGVLVVDTGLGTRNGETVLAEARKIAPSRQIYLVTTHVHPEHDLGAGAFPADTIMIRSKDEERDIEKNGMTLANMFSKRSEAARDLLTGTSFRKANVEFDRDYTLDLGGLSVQLQSIGPNHTIGDTLIFVPSERVLFAGDLAMNALPVLIPPDSSLKHWLLALDVVEALHPLILVPSHGPIGDLKYVTAARTYLKAVQQDTNAAKARGETLEQAIGSVTAELTPQYKAANRIRGSVQVAYAEAP